jgi:hypothetical protein
MLSRHRPADGHLARISPLIVWSNHEKNKGGMMSEESSTPVSRDAAIKKGWLHRLLGIYEIVIIVFLWKHFVGSQDE